jgi:hypothetical protein
MFVVASLWLTPVLAFSRDTTLWGQPFPPPPPVCTAEVRPPPRVQGAILNMPCARLW